MRAQTLSCHNAEKPQIPEEVPVPGFNAKAIRDAISKAESICNDLQVSLDTAVSVIETQFLQWA